MFAGYTVVFRMTRMFSFTLVPSSIMDLLYLYKHIFCMLFFIYFFALLHVMPLILRSSIITPIAKNMNFASSIK